MHEAAPWSHPSASPVGALDDLPRKRRDVGPRSVEPERNAAVRVHDRRTDMKPALRLVTERGEAGALAPALDAYAAQALAEFRDTPLPEGVCRRFFDKHFDDSQSVLVIAESKRGAANLGVCLTGPFEDPLTAERTPIVLILYVSPDMRHRGLGSALIQQALKELAGRGHAKLAGRAGQNDDALISMGERWGFVRVWDLLLRE